LASSYRSFASTNWPDAISSQLASTSLKTFGAFALATS
jgi:hypothetical protein